MSALRRLAEWLSRPGPCARLRAAEARLARLQALRTAEDAVARDAGRAADEAMERDLLRHTTCQRLQASGRCIPLAAPRELTAAPTVVPDPAPDAAEDAPRAVVPDGVPDYLVELVEREGRSA